MFFVIIVVFGNKIMLSLFTAILLENFEAGNDDDEEEQEKEAENKEPVSSLSRKMTQKATYQVAWENFKDFFGYRPTIKDLEKRFGGEQPEKDPF